MKPMHVISLVVLLYIIVVAIQTAKYQEGYSPYREIIEKECNTQPDAYNSQDYYIFHPFIYPTPTNYIRQVYADRRS